MKISELELKYSYFFRDKKQYPDDLEMTEEVFLAHMQNPEVLSGVNLGQRTRFLVENNHEVNQENLFNQVPGKRDLGNDPAYEVLLENLIADAKNPKVVDLDPDLPEPARKGLDIDGVVVPKAAIEGVVVDSNMNLAKEYLALTDIQARLNDLSIVDPEVQVILEALLAEDVTVLQNSIDVRTELRDKAKSLIVLVEG